MNWYLLLLLLLLLLFGLKDYILGEICTYNFFKTFNNIYIGLKCSNDKKKKIYGLMIFKAYTLLTNTLKKKKVNTLITTKMV